MIQNVISTNIYDADCVKMGKCIVDMICGTGNYSMDNHLSNITDLLYETYNNVVEYININDTRGSISLGFKEYDPRYIDTIIYTISEYIYEYLKSTNALAQFNSRDRGYVHVLIGKSSITVLDISVEPTKKIIEIMLVN